MAEGLVLIHTPVQYGTKEASGERAAITVDRVVGLVDSASKPVMEYGYEFSGNESETDLRLAAGALERIADFYEQTRAREPGKTRFYNCHVFVNYVFGKTVELPTGCWWWKGWRTEPAAPANLQPGEPYGIMNDDENSTHSLLGVNRPDMNLSVLGDLQPLALSRTEDLLAPYGGIEVARYI